MCNPYNQKGASEIDGGGGIPALGDKTGNREADTVIWGATAISLVGVSIRSAKKA
jgi:hypothetical protein